MTATAAETGAMHLHIDIAIEGGNWPPEDELRPMIERALRHAATVLGLAGETSELSVVLTDDATIRTLNAKWRRNDKATNVLSFPAYPMTAGDPPGPLLGDIVLARETIEREAAIDGKNIDAHFTHLIVHGFLHLLGYDHELDDDADEMERLERAILADLGIDDPYTPISDDMKDDGRPTS